MMTYITRLIALLSLMIAASAVQAQDEYRARAGDVLLIEVLEDPSLDRSVTILPDGRFSFPFAGTLRGAGRSVSQLQSVITTAIASNFAAAPTVFVAIQPKERPVPVPGPPPEPETINIYFLGEVNTPGLREVEPGTTFLQAVAQSGGLTRFAATKRIQLRRTGAGGQQTVRAFDYKALSEGSALAQDPKLRDGDIILVPERRLFE